MYQSWYCSTSFSNELSRAASRGNKLKKGSLQICSQSVFFLRQVLVLSSGDLLSLALLSVAFACRNKSHVFFCRSVKVNVSDSCRSTGFSMKFPKEGNTRLTIYATAYAVYSMCTPFQRARPCPAGEPGQKQRSMLQKEIMSQAYLCGYEHEHESRYSSRYKYVFVQVATVHRQIGVRGK